MTTAEQLIEDFETYGVTISDNKLVEKCLSLCSQYNLDGEGIAISWMAFASKYGYSSVSLEHLEQLEREQLAKEKTVKKVESFQVFNVNTIRSIDDDADNDDDDLLAAYGAGGGGGGGTPSSKGKRQTTPDKNVIKRHMNNAKVISAQFSPANASPSVGTPSQKYSSRTNAGSVLASYGDVDKATWSTNKEYTPQVKPIDAEALTTNYKYMFERLRDMAEVLDDTISIMGDELKEVLKVDEYSNLTAASNEVITVCGRICCDSVGRLNAASVLLEGSREHGRGIAVPLDLSQLKQFSLFPGQVVGLRGVNSTGKKLVAQELIPGKVLPLPKTPITITRTDGPVQVMIACGPFTTTDNLLYEPLTDFLTKVQENPPHLLILTGPILDAAHPHVLNNELNETHESAFNRCVKIINSSLERTGTQVVLVSSNRDVCGHLVYPTPPYNIGGHIKCVRDPSLLDVEGVIIGVTATDILFHLGKEETSYPPQGSDRLGRLTNHLLLQQSLYPLYPPPEGMCMDRDSTDTLARLTCTPHLLVLPSDLRHFIRDLHGCVVVNPERLAKGLAGGTYAKIELHPPKEERGSMVGAAIGQIVKV